MNIIIVMHIIIVMPEQRCFIYFMLKKESFAFPGSFFKIMSFSVSLSLSLSQDSHQLQKQHVPKCYLISHPKVIVWSLTGSVQGTR